jgi:AP-1 complex subunit beta-1
VTLLSSPPEVQWIALRNINLLLQKRSDILSNEMRVFFCKYNDPLYVKVEKLDIMVRLANENNFDALLSELKEYVCHLCPFFCSEEYVVDTPPKLTSIS